MKKEAIRVVSTIPVAPTTLYFAWLSSEQHAAMTGGAAKIEPNVGSKYTAWNGYISGKLVTLDLGRRIIMSWRTTDFPRDATDSRVEIHLEALGGNTRVTILHTEIPEGQGEKYREGWNDKYFTPMRTYFSKYLPDPRKPPPPRRPPPPPEEDEEEETTPAKGAKGIKGKGPSVAKAPPSKKAVAAKAAPPPPSKKPAAKSAPPPPSKKPAAKPAPKPAPKPAAKPAPSKAPAKKAPPKKPAKPAKPAKKKNEKK